MRLSLEVEEEYERLRVQREEASQWAMARETTAPAAGGTAPRVLRTELTPSPPPASDAWMECVTDMRAEALNQGSICPYGSTPTASDPAGGLYVYHPDLGPVRQEMLVTPPRDRDRDRAGNGDGEWDGAKSPVDTDLYMNHYNSYLHTGNSRSSEADAAADHQPDAPTQGTAAAGAIDAAAAALAEDDEMVSYVGSSPSPVPRTQSPTARPPSRQTPDPKSSPTRGRLPPAAGRRTPRSSIPKPDPAAAPGRAQSPTSQAAKRPGTPGATRPPRTRPKTPNIVLAHAGRTRPQSPTVRAFPVPQVKTPRPGPVVGPAAVRTAPKGPSRAWGAGGATEKGAHRGLGLSLGRQYRHVTSCVDTRRRSGGSDLPLSGGRSRAEPHAEHPEPPRSARSASGRASPSPTAPPKVKPQAMGRVSPCDRPIPGAAAKPVHHRPAARRQELPSTHSTSQRTPPRPPSPADQLTPVSSGRPHVPPLNWHSAQDPDGFDDAVVRRVVIDESPRASLNATPLTGVGTPRGILSPRSTPREAVSPREPLHDTPPEIVSPREALRTSSRDSVSTETGPGPEPNVRSRSPEMTAWHYQLWQWEKEEQYCRYTHIWEEEQHDRDTLVRRLWQEMPRGPVHKASVHEAAASRLLLDDVTALSQRVQHIATRTSAEEEPEAGTGRRPPPPSPVPPIDLQSPGPTGSPKAASPAAAITANVQTEPAAKAKPSQRPKPQTKPKSPRTAVRPQDPGRRSPQASVSRTLFPDKTPRQGAVMVYPDPPAIRPPPFLPPHPVEPLEPFVPLVQDYRETRGAIVPATLGAVAHARDFSTVQVTPVRPMVTGAIEYPTIPVQPVQRPKVPALPAAAQVHPQPMPVPAVQLQPMATPQPVMVPTVPVQPLQPVIVRSHAEPVLYAQEEAYSAVRVPAQPPSVRFAVNDVYTLQHHKVAYVYPEARGYGSRSASPVLAVTDWAPRSSVRSASPPVSVQELRSMSPTLMQHRHCTTCTCQSCKSS